jgi:DNA-binding FrmR family transcriptional regulator
MTYGYVEEKDALVKRLHRIEGRCAASSGWSRTSATASTSSRRSQAATTALETVAFKILDEHVNHCVAGALESGDADVAAEKSRELLEAVHRFSRTK